MTRPPATRRDHDRFCVTEGWAVRRTATGRTGTHHVNYELALPDGRILLTRVSHPVDATDYGKQLWSHILRDQLQVTEDEFWACVNDRALPDRGAPTVEAEPIPANVAWTLVHEARLPDERVRAMSRDEALDAFARFYRTGSAD